MEEECRLQEVAKQSDVKRDTDVINIRKIYL